MGRRATNLEVVLYILYLEVLHLVIPQHRRAGTLAGTLTGRQPDQTQRQRPPARPEGQGGPGRRDHQPSDPGRPLEAERHWPRARESERVSCEAPMAVPDESRGRAVMLVGVWG
jgi:hypothetical protein